MRLNGRDMPDAILNGYAHHWEEAGTGDPLVMLHGAAGSGLTLRSHATALSRSFHTILVDMRGMGRSAHVASIPPSAWIDDLVALLDHLGIGNAHLYGSSLGARVALRTAVDHARVARSLILDHPIIAIAPTANSRLNERFTLANIDDARRRSYREQHGEDWETVIENYHRIRNQPDLQAHLDLREPSKSVTVPTLIIRGDEVDATHPLADAVALHENIRGSQLWIRPNTPSKVINAAPDETYEQIVRFTRALVPVA